MALVLAPRQTLPGNKHNGVCVLTPVSRLAGEKRLAIPVQVGLSLATCSMYADMYACLHVWLECPSESGPSLASKSYC